MPFAGAFAHSSSSYYSCSRASFRPGCLRALRCLHHSEALKPSPSAVRVQSPSKRRRATPTTLGRVIRLQKRSTDIDELNQRSLAGLAKLSVHDQKFYLFTTWIKKLVAFRSPDTASQVLELMWERGLRPNAEQLDTLIGAWFRDHKEGSAVKAEHTAREMIHKRAALANRAESTSATAALLPPISSPTRTDEGKWILTFVQRACPPASPSTYFHLIKHCLKHQRWTDVAAYRRLMLQAGIPMSTQLSNNFIYAEMRNKRYKRAWIKYRSIASPKRPPTIEPPNLLTHALLWQCCKHFLDTPEPAFIQRFPPPRRLMWELVSWFRSLTGQRRQEALEDFKHENTKEKLFPLIAKCFARASDMPGLLVALYIMGINLGVPAHPGIAAIVLGMVARWDMPSKTPRMRRNARESIVYKERVRMLGLALQAERDRRKELVHDTVPEESEEAKKNRVELEAVSEILRIVMTKMADPAIVQAAVDQAKVEMGLEEHLYGEELSCSV